MLNLQDIKRVAIVGGGTAGSFAALSMRALFDAEVEVVLIESPDVKEIGVGEGGLLNFITALQEHKIDIDDFIQATGASYKLGFAYEGWRTGKENDIYYHPFANLKDTMWLEQGHYPYVSGLTAHQMDLTTPIPEMQLIDEQCSQATVKSTLKHDSQLLASLHFDGYKVGEYLKKVALSRGVKLKSASVQDVQLDNQKQVTALQFSGSDTMPVDFVIDASGMSRVVIGKKLNATWMPFSQHLLMDRAIPFYMPHPLEQPYLVTRAIAMDAGWMWQTPLKDRVGAGYVYSSQHISDEQALQSIHQTIQSDIELKPTISFEPGCYIKPWQGNVMAIGLASGFVEPLEATSIGQMLEQLRNLKKTLSHCNQVVSTKVIDEFNKENLKYWHGIRDFLRMHYDTPRRDTAFWRDVANLPLPATYQALKDVWAIRSPCLQDVTYAQSGGWNKMFHLLNWVYVGTALGVMPASVAQQELKKMPAAWQKKIDAYINVLKEINQHPL